MDEHFYRDRARALRKLASEADPFIRKRLLRLASNYDDMTTRQNTGGQVGEKSAQGSDVDSLDGN